MAGRRYQRLRAAGQDAPPGGLQTCEALSWGDNLIAWPTPFAWDEAAAAWQAHRHAVLESWRRDWETRGALPICWAERVFDGTPQIATAGLSSWARDQIRGIEREVNLRKTKGKK